jgi:hypothetical protein
MKTTNNPLSIRFTKSATLAAAAFAVLAPVSHALTFQQGTFSMDPTAVADLGANAFIVNTSPYATIRGYVVTGFNAGGWDGVGGISSSAAAGNYPLALGIIDNSIANFPTFEGATTSLNTETLIRYTYYADADLNGVVNGDDLNLLIDGLNLNNPANDWLWGDFDYSGGVNGDDLNLFLDTFNLPAIVLFGDGGGKSGSVVPEPGSLAMLLISAVGLLSRRRRS